jgi:hypothetical protein
LEDVDWAWLEEKFVQLSNIGRKSWAVDHNNEILLNIRTSLKKKL